MCRGIRPIVGCRVIDVAKPICRRRAIAIEPRVDRFRRRAVGKLVVAIRRAGKRVVVWLADDDSGNNSTDRKALERTSLRIPSESALLPGNEAVVFEPRMTGLVLLSEPPTRAHLRFQIRLSAANRGSKSGARNGGSIGNGLLDKELLFWDRRGLGSVCLYSAADFFARFHGEHRKLGPDALEISPGELRTRLRYSRRAVKVALLDQASVAGIGNLYASEILHVAGVHPAARCDRLKLAQWERIHIALRDVLLTAIRYEGSTLADGTYRNALNQSGSYQNHHRVYDRAGVPCGSCGRGTIRRIVQAQRSTFFCAQCQAR